MSAAAVIMSGKSKEPTAVRYLGLAIPLVLYLIGACVFFRAQIFSNFDRVFNANLGADIRLVALIHENTFRWLHSQAEFLSPPFFFNQKDTLGYSDAFVLDQAVYAPMRLFGAEPFLALSLTAVVLSAIAYLFLYLFLRRLEVSIPLASFAALIFTFANNLYLKSWHFQHFAVYYIPIVAYCGLLAVSDLHRRPLRACLLGGLAAGLYGLLLSTGYYMAWFFGLGLLIFTPIFVCLAWPPVFVWWRKGPTRVLGLGLAAGVGFAAALSIFAMIYAPVLAIGAKRSFNEYLNLAPQPNDIVNVGMENLVWGGLISALQIISDDRLYFGEVSIALTPTVQILLGLSVLLACRASFWPADTVGRISRAVVIASAGVCAVFYLVTIKVHNFSLFHILYAHVPGANAIRAGFRCMVVANLFAATAISLAVDRMFRSSAWQPRPLTRFGRIGAVTALLALAAVEQVNFATPSRLSREFARAHLSAVGRAPRECRAFYVASKADDYSPDSPDVVQSDAMMVALAQQLPTLNGLSSVFPPGWDLFAADSDYEKRVARWARDRGIVEGLCRVDIESGTWMVMPH